MLDERYYYLIIKNKKINKILSKITIGTTVKTNEFTRMLDKQAREGRVAAILEEILLNHINELKKLVKKHVR